MASIKKFNKDTQSWEVFGATNANQINVMDLSQSFTSKNVEGVLGEIAKKQQDIEGDVEWLKINGGGGSGGGSGGSAPTITSTFEDNMIVDKTSDVIIPVFFNSLNLGNGLIYVSINGIEQNAIAIKQGNNKINIGKLTNIKNTIMFYAKDRTGALSNQLLWTITAGGIDFTLDFDYSADYIISDDVVMRYHLSSAGSSPIILHLTIDFNEYTFEAYNGNNEYIFPKLSIGVHKIKMKFTSDNYFTSETVFNLVIVSSDKLYLSTYFEGGTFEYGLPVSIDYRISKNSKEHFDIYLKLDGETKKVLSAPAGSYSWTLNDIPIGPHDVQVLVTSEYGETANFERQLVIEEGEYTPLKIDTQNLIYRLYAGDKTNNDSDKTSPQDASGNQVKTTLHNFNFFTNGWINGALVCDGNAYVEIDCTPWTQNAIYGSTIEIQYKALDIGNDEARIFDYTDIEIPHKGIYIDINECTIKSIANTGTSYLNKDEWITVSFVIDRKNKFCKTYIDGVCNRAFYLSDTGTGTSTTREDFSHAQKIYLNSAKGTSQFGACEIKDVRIYNRTLTDDEILSNFIAQEKDVAKQKQEYLFNFENTSVPIIEMYGETSNMTLETPVSLRVKYTSPNEDLYGQSFDLPYCDVSWQGTSSLQYVLKNYTLNLKDSNMAPFEYTPFQNGVPETVFCLKCDYMESTHSRNTGLAKFVNESLYDTKNPAQLKDARYRNSINGFPVLLYINSVLQGVYNFNLDRYSVKSYGYKDFNKAIIYEVSANSDTTAGAFYKWTSSSGKDEISYYRSDFEPIYPPTRVAGNDDFAEIIRLVNWVNDSSNEDFKDNFNQYFNLEYVIRYYLTVMVFGAVDSLGKNMKLASFDGLIWYPQMYDLDTTIGLDNTGFLKFDADIEIGDEGVFNTTKSLLWEKVKLLFTDEIKQQYSLMRQGRFTVNNIMKFLFDEQIEKIPKRFYNWDMREKYLNYQSSYLYALHGNSYHHLKKWIQERLIYVDTLIGYTNSTADYITVRSSKLGKVYLDIETYIPMYLRVKWRDEANNTGVQIKRISKGEKVRFEYNMPTATDQEIIIYGGHYLKSIGDISNLQPTTMLIANADRLAEITCHSSNLINTDLNMCTKLQYIDLSNCPALGTGIGAQPILNIQQCKYLRSVNVSGTAITAVYTMAAGGNLEEMYLSDKTQSIAVSNQKHLKILGIPYDESSETYCRSLSTVTIENCNNIEYIHYPFKSQDLLQFKALKFVRSLSLIRSLDKLKTISFSNFNYLSTLSVSNMPFLENLGFEDMLDISSDATLKSIRIGDCPLITSIDFKVTDELHKISFAKDSVLDLSGLQSLKTLSNNCPVQGLKTLIVPNSLESIIFNDAGISHLNVGRNDVLKVLSVSNCPDLTGVLDLSGCNSIQEIEIVGTTISQIKLPSKNIVLKTLTLPSTLTTLSLVNQPNLTTYQSDGYENLTSLEIENTPIVNPIFVFNNAPKLERVRLINVNIKSDYKTVSRLMEKQGFNASGDIAPISQSISGKIAFEQCSVELLARFKEALPLVTFATDVIVQQYNVSFIDSNGVLLYKDYVILHGGAVYLGETPQKTSTAQYDYVFNVWDKDYSDITGDTTVTALFSEVLRSYTIKFINGNTSEIISKQTVLYGKTPVPPELPAGLNNWGEFITPVTGDKTYTAIHIPYPEDLSIFTFAAFGDGYSVALKNIVCPDTIIYPFEYNGKPVVKIEQPSNDTVSRAQIKSVYIPNTIRTLGANAFRKFTGLTQISIPDSVVTLGINCFSNCTALTTLTLPENITNIGDNCFSGCSGFQTMYNNARINQTVGTTIFADAKPTIKCDIYGYPENIQFLTAVNDTKYFNWIMPDATIKLGDNIVATYEKNTRHLNVIGSGPMYNWKTNNCPLFVYRSAFKTIEIDSRITTFGDYCFYECKNLTHISIPKTVTYLGNSSLLGCTSLTKIDIPSTVKDIGTYCFAYCTSLTEIDIPNGISAIRDGCFSKCNSLAKVVIPSTVVSLGEYCFNTCSKLKTIYNYSKTSQSIHRDAFIWSYPSPKCQVFGYYENTYFMQALPSSYFDFIPFEMTIAIGDNITATFNPDTRHLNIVGSGNTYNWTNGNSAFAYFSNAIKTVTISKNITGLGDYCFHNCTSLTQITIPNGVTSLGNYCFYNCASLTQVTIPEGITSLDGSCFGNCSSLTQIVIPNGVTSLGNYCFYKCGTLTQITIPESVTSIGNYCFYNCDSLTQITIPESVTSIGGNCFGGCSKLSVLYNYSKINQTIGANIFDYARPWPNCQVYGYSTNTNFKNALTTRFTWNELIQTASITESLDNAAVFALSDTDDSDAEVNQAKTSKLASFVRKLFR